MLKLKRKNAWCRKRDPSRVRFDHRMSASYRAQEKRRRFRKLQYCQWARGGRSEFISGEKIPEHIASLIG